MLFKWFDVTTLTVEFIPKSNEYFQGIKTVNAARKANK